MKLFECIEVIDRYDYSFGKPTQDGELINEGETKLAVGQWRQATKCEQVIKFKQTDFTDTDYAVIRAEADRYAVEVRTDEDDDHGYSQTNSETMSNKRQISDDEIIVRNGAFWGIIAYSKRCSFNKRVYVINRYEYLSIDDIITDKKSNIHVFHDGYSSDNGSHSTDKFYYLRPCNCDNNE